MTFLPASPATNNQWTVAGIQLPGPTHSDSTIEFAVRPEDLRLVDAHGKDAMTATVRVVEPLGSHILASCLVDEQLFRVVLDSDHPVTAGNTLYLKPMLDRIRWFDQKTEKAV